MRKKLCFIQMSCGAFHVPSQHQVTNDSIPTPWPLELPIEFSIFFKWRTLRSEIVRAVFWKTVFLHNVKIKRWKRCIRQGKKRFYKKQRKFLNVKKLELTKSSHLDAFFGCSNMKILGSLNSLLVLPNLMFDQLKKSPTLEILDLFSRMLEIFMM